MEVGEYAGDYGFPLPKPVSIQSRISMIQVLGSVMYAETSKNEDTWYDMLGDFRSRIRYNPESTQRVVAQKAFHSNRR